jgi:hypothetical protein
MLRAIVSTALKTLSSKGVRNAARFLTTDKKLLKGAADAVSALVGAGGKVSSEKMNVSGEVSDGQ